MNHIITAQRLRRVATQIDKAATALEHSINALPEELALRGADDPLNGLSRAAAELRRLADSLNPRPDGSTVAHRVERRSRVKRS